MATDNTLEELRKAVIEGNRNIAPKLAKRAIDEGASPLDTIMQACYPAMLKVGELYQEGEYFLSEMLMAAKTFEAVMNVVEPLLGNTENAGKGTIVIGTCKDDIHSLGKNLVAAMLRASGFKVIDLGEDVPTEEFAKAAMKSNADVVAISALMTTTMPSMQAVVEHLRAQNLPVKIIVGGGPITKEYAESIGADGYGKDAVDAVNVVEKLIHS